MTHTDSPPPRGKQAPPVDAAAHRHLEGEEDDEIAPEVERQIDENLRLLYRQRLEQDLPDDLMALVAQLRDGEGQA